MKHPSRCLPQKTLSEAGRRVGAAVLLFFLGRNAQRKRQPFGQVGGIHHKCELPCAQLEYN